MKLLTNLLFEPRGRHNPALAYSIKDTVMSADGTRVYFALQDVPPGVSLENTDYWILQIDLSNVQASTPNALIGATSKLTPSQVAQAVSEGRNVVVTHVQEQFGTLGFTSFILALDMYMVVSSGVFALGENVAVCQLLGDYSSDAWSCTIHQLI